MTYTQVSQCYIFSGARIDHGHHYNKARVALEETLAFEKAVTRALELVSLEDTLIIVTSDHSHPMTKGSFASRGNDILGEYMWPHNSPH